MTAGKILRVLLLTVILLLLMSGIAAAQEQPKYIYFERGSGVFTSIRMVDYEEAIALLPGVTLLYDETVNAMQTALGNFKRVWIEVQLNGDWYVLDYSAAVNDGVSYTAMINLTKANNLTYVTTRPEANDEMYYDPVTDSIRYRLPQIDPTEHPPWLVDLGGENYIRTYWEELGGFWLVEVEIDEANLPGNYQLGDINEVRIRVAIDGTEQYGTAVRKPGSNIWRARFDVGNEGSALILNPGGVRIRIMLTWYG